MEVSIIVASQRENSQSGKVAKYIANQLNIKDTHPVIVSLENNQLPLWTVNVEEDLEVRKLADSIRNNLKSSSASIIVVPEWNGSITPALANLFLYIDKSIAHKPVLLVSVSAGQGGAYPIAEIRSFHTKNNYPIFIPNHVIIRDVNNVLNLLKKHETKEDLRIRERLNWSIEVLLEYSKYLNDFRNNTNIDLNKYANGM